MNWFSIDRPWRARAAALMLAAGAVLALQAGAGGWLRIAEDLLADWAWRWGAQAQEERRVVVVDIDEASLRQHGPWPWSRAKLAELSTRLREAGAAVQVYDMVFAEPREGDDLLRQAWSRTPVVVGQIFSLSEQTQPAQGQVGGSLGACSALGGDWLPRAHGVVANSPGLGGPALSVGHMTPRLEADGVVRRVPALICYQGQVYPSLALAALERLGRAEPGQAPAPWQVRRAGQPGAVFSGGTLEPPLWLESTQVPGLVVPLDGNGDLLVPYRVRRSALLSVSAADLLAGRVEAPVLQGAIAVVGATAFGLSDTIATPLSSIASGVEVHVQSLAGLLDHRAPYRPAVALPIAWLAVAGVGLVLLVLAGRRKLAPRTLPLTGLALAAMLALGASAALPVWNLSLPWTLPALYALLASGVLAALEHGLTKGQRERLSAHLQAYLPAPVAQKLASLEPSGALQAQRREVTVMAADLRNFYAFTTHRSPEEVAATLHAYACLAVDAIERHGGVVEHMAGDRILAVWNAYAQDANHAQRAMDAARDLVLSLRELLAAQTWESESAPDQPLALGIGLESGAAIVGSFGPARRRAHAALGEPVSVAAQLQAMTSDLSVPVLVGPHLAAALSAASLTSMGEYLVEGQVQSLQIFVPKDWAQWAPPETVWPSQAEHEEPSKEAEGLPQGWETQLRS